MKPRTKKEPTAPLLPATRAVRWLHERGWDADYAERSMGRIKKDWCGFADIIAVHPFGAVLFLQVTSAKGGGNFAKRVKKVQESEVANRLAVARHRVEVWGYNRGRHLKPDRIWVMLDPTDA